MNYLQTDLPLEINEDIIQEIIKFSDMTIYYYNKNIEFILTSFVIISLVYQHVLDT